VAELALDWFYDRMKLIKIFAKDIEVEEVAVCIPLEYKSACLIYELSKYTTVYAAKLDEFSTKSEALRWLAEKGIEVKRKKDVVNAEYFLDCSAALSRVAARSGREKLKVVELTKTGEDYLRSLGVKIKAISLDSSVLKGEGENVHGTAFGLVEALLRMNIYLPGKKVLVVGFGRVGRGCARLLRAIGCRVSVWDVDERRQIEAIYEGFEVDSSFDAELIVTCTGLRGVFGQNEIRRIPEGCLLVNLGAEVEIMPAGELKKDYGLIKEYSLEGKSYYLVADGYAANLALANGTPLEVMDRTFSAAILALNHIARSEFEGIIPLPQYIESTILAAIKMFK